jgi:hypothetical protein
MKIYEGNEDAMSVYLDFDDTIIIAYTNFGRIEILKLIPSEALNLSETLKSVCDKTEYFRGFKKEDNEF